MLIEIDEIDNFLNQSKIRTNKWIYTDIYQIYLRISRRYLDKERTCIDIASIEVLESYRRQGTFSYLIQYIHRQHHYEATYLESVHAPEIFDWPKRHGWTVSRSDPFSFYLLK